MEIEEVHSLLENIERVIKEISRLQSKSYDVRELSNLGNVIIEVLDWERSASPDNKLNIHPSLLNKFLKQRGKVTDKDAAIVADRIRAYLRSQDQTTEGAVRAVPAPRSPRPKRDRPTEVAAPFSFKAEQWVAVTRTSENARKIAALAAILDSIIEQTAHANAPEDQQALTKIEREQLIAILETALSVLRSPIVETGLMKKARAALERGAISAAEKGLQEGLGALMGVASHGIGDLIASLFS
jgi:hypothetical protein